MVVVGMTKQSPRYSAASRRKVSEGMMTGTCLGVGRETAVGHVDHQEPVKSFPKMGEYVVKNRWKPNGVITKQVERASLSS